MFNKKAQMEARELVITLVIAGILVIVGLLIFANVSNTAEKILDPLVNTQANESITIDAVSGSDNSTLLAKARVLTLTTKVRNATNQTELYVENTDYTLTLTGTSGAIGTRANLTLTANSSADNVALKVTYQFNGESSAQATTSQVQTTVLDSFSLGVIALIVLAAVAILAILFKLGTG